MKTGWFQVNGKWYYAYSSGALAVNTTVDGYSVNYNGEWVNNERGDCEGNNRFFCENIIK